MGEKGGVSYYAGGGDFVYNVEEGVRAESGVKGDEGFACCCEE